MEGGQASYEPPAIRTVGSLYELTQQVVRQNGNGQWCIWDKTIGPPDYWACIPVTNCS